MRLLLALALTAAACADDHDSADTAEAKPCELPDTVVAIRTELSGNCGPVPRVLTMRGREELPEDCTYEPDSSAQACWLGGYIECADGSKRQWWVDGRNGWVGEDFIQTPTCESRYRLELELR